MIDKLRKHLSETPEEELKKEWEEVSEWSEVRPSANDYLVEMEEIRRWANGELTIKDIFSIRFYREWALPVIWDFLKAPIVGISEYRKRLIGDKVLTNFGIFLYSAWMVLYSFGAVFSTPIWALLGLLFLVWMGLIHGIIIILKLLWDNLIKPWIDPLIEKVKKLVVK